MAETNTPNYNLIKPDPLDFYDVGKFNENADLIDAELKNINDNAATHKADYVAHPANGGTTAGTATAYTCDSSPNPTELVDKIGIVLTAHVDSEANPTLKWGASAAYPIIGKFKKDVIYTLRFNATTSAFILQGEGGDFTAQQRADFVTTVNKLLLM